MINRITLLLFIGLAFGSDSERIISKWDNGVTKRIQYYTGSGFDEVLIGIKTFYPNGDLRWKCKYQNNKRHGEYFFYLEGNNLLLKGNFNNGESYGNGWYAYHPVEMFSDKGYSYFREKLPSYLADFLNATEYIVQVGFHDNGELDSYQLKIKSNVKTDYGGEFPFHDTSYYWHENGMIERIIDYFGVGESYGFEQKIWLDSGELDSEMVARDEMTTMKTTVYYKNGNKKWSKETIKGEEIYNFRYDHNGNLKKINSK